jgi:hypothetical protein
MTTSICIKSAAIVLAILGLGLLVIPYPALRQLVDDRNLMTYNCTDARNFTYSGKSRGAYRATAIANMTVPDSQPANTTTPVSKIVVVKLRYPGLTTWLPYSFNTRDDTVRWYSGISKSVSRRGADQVAADNTTYWFQCVSDTNLVGGYTQPALPNLPLYYASCAGGVIFMFLGMFICCMNNRRERRARYDYIYLN